MKTRKIGLANYLAYGSGDFLGAGTTALTAAWLLYFYTTFCGLTPIEATFIFAAARVLDAVVSPLMGFLTDNFGTTWLGRRFGRRKFFILLGIPCVFSYSLMWVGDMNFWYYLLTYLVFDIVYTMILVPYETLVPEMTDDFKQKTKFSGRVFPWRRCPPFWPPFCQGYCSRISVKTMRSPSSMQAWFSPFCAP